MNDQYLQKNIVEHKYKHIILATSLESVVAVPLKAFSKDSSSNGFVNVVTSLKCLQTKGESIFVVYDRLDSSDSGNVPD